MAKGDYGHNGTISAPGMGTRRIRVVGLELRLGIIATADEEARRRKAFYSVVVTGSSFGMDIAFVSWEERERFNSWMRRYIERVVEGSAKNGYMTILCPGRKFMRTAIPETDLEFGEGLTDVGYVTSLEFVGASDPLNNNLRPRMRGLSYFKGPGRNSTEAHFYPAGVQVGGAESLEGTLFDVGGAAQPGVVAADREDPNDISYDFDRPGIQR